jgi:hypothetical protein
MPNIPSVLSLVKAGAGEGVEKSFQKLIGSLKDGQPLAGMPFCCILSRDSTI